MERERRECGRSHRESERGREKGRSLIQSRREEEEGDICSAAPQPDSVAGQDKK